MVELGETPVFTRADDGTVRLVGAWPPTAVFSRRLLAEAERTLLRYDGDRVGVIEITVANGAATYRVTEQDAWTDSVTAELVWFRAPEPGQPRR